MKIIAGQFKGKNFYRPQDIRPTQNVGRKALFDILGGDLEGLSVLDLFAGSGAVGLEALSRGAEKVVFVEKDPKCFQVIEKNIELLSVQPNAKRHWPFELNQADAFAAIKSYAAEKRRFDVIFVDPPYARGLAKKALKTLEAYDILQPNCTLIIEHEKREILPAALGRIILFREKKYGTSVMGFYRVK